MYSHTPILIHPYSHTPIFPYLPLLFVSRNLNSLLSHLHWEEGDGKRGIEERVKRDRGRGEEGGEEGRKGGGGRREERKGGRGGRGG